ncbi:hypothetical protein BDB00DRAFT_356335 [Zychaea mexicana]|uniref:uncharacterized protein n=1 Tax=Zychaea mexicana TaxID=64656 RepID=UPI0022FF3031|nr:uncharacterized protein BDB00DRAFT_356335 [Zychaea mexicana]KAI9493827.1 hypothetical protein BDB00DRAFT_356335 [Zychaea mexicana]
MSNVTAKRLADQHRCARCVFTYSDTSTLSPFSAVSVEKSHVSFSHIGVRSVTVTNDHENSTTSTSMGSQSEHSHISLSRRPADRGQKSAAVSGSDTSHCEVTQPWFSTEGVQVSTSTITENRTSGLHYQHVNDVPISVNNEVARLTTRSAQTSQSSDSHCTSSVILHWEGTSNNIGRASSPVIHPSPHCMPQPDASARLRLERSDEHQSSSLSGAPVVVQPSATMERTEFHAVGTGHRSVHRFVGSWVGPSLWQQDDSRQMVSKACNTTRYLQRTFDNTPCDTTSDFARQEASGVLRQHNNHSVRESPRWDEVTCAHEPGNVDLARMSQEQHSTSAVLRIVAVQPSGPTVAAVAAIIGMEHQTAVLSQVEHGLGTTRHRLLCDTAEHEATPVHELEMGSASNSDQCSTPSMEGMETHICMSTVEPSSAGTDQSNHHHTTLTQRHLVSNATTTQQQQTTTSTTNSSNGCTRTRSVTPEQEPTLVFSRMEYKRRRLADAGIATEAESIMMGPTHNQQRVHHFDRIQRSYITWARSHQIDPLTPNPVQLVNYLAYGRVHMGWSTSTCCNYRSTILDLYTDRTTFTSNTMYREFFVALNEQTVRSFDRPHCDIQPVIQHITKLGNNNQIRAIDLTRKLCFLLAITGFLR